MLRSSLRSFISSLGYDAVLSDYSDVLYDPREHAHKSCLAEVRGCDMVVLVIGSRFGSDLDPNVMAKSLHELDLQGLSEEEQAPRLSVTQAEALTAAAEGIPLFAFVDAAVYHDYSVYQRNKGQSFANQIVYPSIAQPETAEHIFNFVDYLQNRTFNNAVVTFERLEEVIEHLQKQWAALFQRMLFEARTRHDEAVRIDRLADQFEDLKTALLTTVGDANTRAVARAVLRYRRLIDILRSLPNTGEPMRVAISKGDANFWELIRLTAGVVAVESREDDRSRLWNGRLQLENGEELMSRYGPEFFNRLSSDWQSFLSLSPSEREVVYDALDTEDRVGPTLFRRERPEEHSDRLRDGTGLSPRGEGDLNMASARGTGEDSTRRTSEVSDSPTAGD